MHHPPLFHVAAKARKHSGFKARIRTTEEREGCVLTVLFLAAIALLIAVLALLANISPKEPTSQGPGEGQVCLKATIIDQLSSSAPNQSFVEASESILKQAGYEVSYYSSRGTDVEFHKNCSHLTSSQ